jgi:hypothetical protein
MEGWLIASTMAQIPLGPASGGGLRMKIAVEIASTASSSPIPKRTSVVEKPRGQ